MQKEVSVYPMVNKAMRTVRAVVFDMDGLMFNTEDVYSLAGDELLGRRGKVFTKELKNAMMGLPPRPSFEAMIEHCNLTESWEELAAESNDIYLRILPEHIRPMPGLFELLDALERAAMPKAIATSSARLLTEATLGQFDLARRFQFVLTAEDITQGKPHPEVYLKAADRLGVSPAEMAVLEDSNAGCRAAAAAGAFCIAVPGPHSRDHDFSMAAAVVNGLDDPQLLRLLGLAAG